MMQHRNVTCTACGCVCDDLQVDVDDGRIVNFSPPCPVADKWFSSATTPPSAEAFVHGRPSSLPEAIEAATELLRASHAPLIYGLAESSTPGQRAAVQLADRLGAYIDTAASKCHGPSIRALQQVGESTCSLGEVKHRADLVIYWGTDPAITQPRHVERFVRTAGEFVDQRTMVVFDVDASSSTAQQADWFIKMEKRSDFELLWTLRALLAGIETERTVIGGVQVAELRRLVDRMKAARCGVFFFGRGLTYGDNGHANVQALLELVRDLNAHTRFHARRMRVYGDVAGADSVLSWQTGFPFSVSLTRGWPRYGPGEYSAGALLTRREVDCALLIGHDGLEALSTEEQQRLAEINTIVLARPDYRPRFPMSVFIPVATYGIHAEGTAYRMDEIPIPLKKIVNTSLPLDAEILAEVERRLDLE